MADVEQGCELFSAGHRACGGCGPALAARLLLKATGKNVIIAASTGCMEVFSTPYPETAWGVPWIHSLFENVAAVASGIEASLKKQGRSEKVVCIAGDGATFDIGVLCISGAFERGHDITYICYDNEAYMNTGIQRSGATPYGASTTTSPAGACAPGGQPAPEEGYARDPRCSRCALRGDRLDCLPKRLHKEGRARDQHPRPLLHPGAHSLLHGVGL